MVRPVLKTRLHVRHSLGCGGALLSLPLYDDDDGIRVAEGELRHRDSDRERVSREVRKRGRCTGVRRLGEEEEEDQIKI